jgi:hypothetical protein
MESYTLTRLDFRCSLINLIILYFTRLQCFIPLSSFRAYRLGYFDIKILFLLRSYYKNATDKRAVVNQARSQEPSKDHQGQVSIIAMLSDHRRQYWTPKDP